MNMQLFQARRDLLTDFIYVKPIYQSYDKIFLAFNYFSCNYK